MALTKRIIPCLDVTTRSGTARVVKGVSFKNLIDAGNPIELGSYYNKEGADELVFLDITASSDERKTLIEMIEKTGENIFIPFTVGGGIRTINDIKKILRAGADKISINTAAIKNPNIIEESSQIFGSQCIVIAIDAKRNLNQNQETKGEKNLRSIEDGNSDCWWEVYINGGRTPTGIDALEWAKKAQKLGCGEILLTSMDYDGQKSGYDIELTKLFSNTLDIPIIASGGAGNPDHISRVFKLGNADAALAASIFHFGQYSIKDVKEYCIKENIRMRINI